MGNKNPFVVVSFVIKGHKNMDKLRASLRRFDVAQDLYVFDDKVGKKYGFSQAVFLKEMLRVHKTKPIVWLSPYAVLRRYPRQFDIQSTTVAIYSHDITTALDTSVIYLANNDASRRVLDMWIKANADFPDRFESENLRRSLWIWHVKNHGQVGRLPDTYSPLSNAKDKVIGREEPPV